MPLPGLRHPASAALCLRLAGRGPNSDSLFPPLAAVATAYAKSAGKTMISNVIATNHPFSGNILS